MVAVPRSDVPCTCMVEPFFMVSTSRISCAGSLTNARSLLANSLNASLPTVTVTSLSFFSG
jgi:hypothetical protein